mmetsp:Transcript_19032/g.41014  ORF Transcript_19032/g.41014 Transcript_19032/m.41014 type:complete len:159 (-) Transcript_19032:2-478(-)
MVLEEELLYRPAVLEAVADCMEDIACILLQNLGFSYQQSLQGVAEGYSMLHASQWCAPAPHVPAWADVQGGNQQTASVPPCVLRRLSPMQVWQCQQSMQLRASPVAESKVADGMQSPTGPVAEDWFVADDVASRQAGLTACGSLVGLLLRSDVRIVNH